MGGLEVITFAVLVMVLNILDSTTTAILFKQYPDEGFKGEGNPFMRFLMLKNKWLAEGVKQGVVLGLVIWCFISGGLVSLKIMGLLLGLVVLNNTYIILGRAIMHRKVRSPISSLHRLLHLPDWGFYPLAVLILLGSACLVINIF